MKYSIKRPVILAGEIAGYEIVDNSNGQIKKYSLDNIAKLAERGLIDAKLAVDSQGNKHLALDNKLSDNVEDMDEYTIECRVVQDGKIVGYKCKNISGQSVRVKPNILWEHAILGRVTNASGKIINDTPTIIGKGCLIKDLPVLKL